MRFLLNEKNGAREVTLFQRVSSVRPGPGSLLLLVLFSAAPVCFPASSAAEPLAPRRKPASQIYARLSEAVVGITCRAPGDQEYFGTGTMIDPTGLVLTSTTVVPEKASRIRLYLRGGRVVAGRLVASNGEKEFALVRVDDPQPRRDAKSAKAFPYVTMGNSARAQLGESVYALGNAFRCIITDDKVAMSAGIVSGLYSLKEKRADSTYVGPVIETNASVNHGMDGGPLVDGHGRLLGVISLNYSRSRWLGTVVPINSLKPLVSPHRGWFSDLRAGCAAYAGLELEEVAGEEIRVLGVATGSPAFSAGVRVGAIVTKVDGKAVRSLEDFTRLFKTKQRKESMVLDTVVDGRVHTANMTLWGKF